MQISLEFFERRRKGWFFTMESIPWEIWSLRIRLVTVATASGLSILKIQLSLIF